MAWETIQDTNLLFVGSWVNREVNAAFAAGSRKATNGGQTNGGSWTYSGYLKGIKIYGVTNFNMGIANVYVDDILVGTFDQYSASAVFQQLVFSKTDIAPGWHTIRVAQSGTKNASASDWYMDIDYIQTDMVYPVDAAGKTIRRFERVVAFGDSITYGLKASAPGTRISEITSRMTGVPVENCGSTGVGIAWLQDVIREVLVPRNPDLVLWVAGANDPGANVQSLLEPACDLLWRYLPKTEVILATITDNTAYSSAETQAKVNGVKNAATSKGLLVVDNYTSTVGNTSIIADTIHPNDTGNAIYAAGFKEQIDKYYQGTKARRFV